VEYPAPPAPQQLLRAIAEHGFELQAKLSPVLAARSPLLFVSRRNTPAFWYSAELHRRSYLLVNPASH